MSEINLNFSGSELVRIRRVAFAHRKEGGSATSNLVLEPANCDSLVAVATDGYTLAWTTVSAPGHNLKDSIYIPAGICAELTRRSFKAAFGGKLKITREGIMFRPFQGIVGAFQEHVAPVAFPKWRKVLPNPKTLRAPTREDLFFPYRTMRKISLVLSDDEDLDPRDFCLVGEGNQLCMVKDGVFAQTTMSIGLTALDGEDSNRMKKAIATLRPMASES